MLTRTCLLFRLHTRFERAKKRTRREKNYWRLTQKTRTQDTGAKESRHSLTIRCTGVQTSCRALNSRTPITQLPLLFNPSFSLSFREFILRPNNSFSPSIFKYLILLLFATTFERLSFLILYVCLSVCLSYVFPSSWNGKIHPPVVSRIPHFVFLLSFRIFLPNILQN